jgi:hypothetical protein
MFHTTGLSNLITQKNVQIKSDYAICTTLSSTNTFNYTFNGGFRPNWCLIDKLTYYNTGTDVDIYLLTADMFSNDIKQFGITFTERNYDSFQGIPHQISLNTNETINFNIQKIAGSGSLGGYIVIEMTFVQSPE